ncbi:MAG: cytochrome c3 family protein [Myxococcota bacterium]
MTGDRWSRRGVAGGAILLLALAVAATAVHADSPDAGSEGGGEDAGEGPAAEDLGDPMTSEGQRRRAEAGLGRQHTPSPLIMPDQRIAVRFTHRVHLEDMDCDDCHASAKDSVRASDVNLPKEEGCFDCHDPEDAAEDPPGYPPALCTTCHPGYEPKMPPDAEPHETSRAQVHPETWEIPPPNLRFNHKVHVDRGIGCTTCHQNMAALDLATRDNALPTMGTCLECHDGDTAPSECKTCHLTNPDGRIDTTLQNQRLEPAGWYFGDAHDDDWLHDHANPARMRADTCNACHAPKDCIDCHNGVKKPLKIHPNNWILTHPVAARKNAPNCSSCHRSQTFCVDCHQQTRVAWEPYDGETGEAVGKRRLREEGVRFHPEGWVDRSQAPFARGRRGPNHHAFEAQRNIRACVSCHTEQTCLTCHSPKVFGAAAASPHPPGWGSSGRCRRMLQRNHRACVKCHSLADPLLDLCR